MKKSNVLIVDDEKDLLYTLKEALEPYKGKLQLAFATNISKAREIINNFPVDVIVTDVKMPGGTGIDLLLNIRKKYPNVKVIIMTGYGDEDMKRSVLYQGAAAFLEKPFEPRQLVRVILDIISQKPNEDFLQKTTIMELLQYMNLSHYTGSIVLKSALNQQGHIHIHRGQIVEAETGPLKGLEAVTRMVSWKRPEITTVELPSNVPLTPIGSMQSILMHAAKIIDES